MRLAYDADFATNDVVALSLARAARGLVAAGYKLEAERWDRGEGKGIDDVLAAGGSAEVLSGLEAIQFTLGRARGHGTPARVEKDEVLAWVRWYLENDLGGDLFKDNELLAAAGGLENHDPAVHAALVTLLKQHKNQTTPTVFFKAAKHEARGANKQASGPIERFTEHDGCTYLVTSDKDGNALEIMLADFTARIVREIMRHEGGETRLQFEIKGVHHPRGHGGGRFLKVCCDGVGGGSRLPVHSGCRSRSEGSVTRGGADAFALEQCGSEDRHLHLAGMGGDQQPASLPACWRWDRATGQVAVNVEPPSVLNKYTLPAPPVDHAVLAAAVEACLDILCLAKADRPGARGMAAVIAASPGGRY